MGPERRPVRGDGYVVSAGLVGRQPGRRRAVCPSRLSAGRTAGCQFPLAESGDVERGLGSRHRAAVGMSQEGDAVVIVVSEETGTISVAIRGQLRRGLSAAALRDLLSKELATDRRARSETPAAAQVPKPEEAEGGTGQAA